MIMTTNMRMTTRTRTIMATVITTIIATNGRVAKSLAPWHPPGQPRRSDFAHAAAYEQARLPTLRLTHLQRREQLLDLHPPRRESLLVQVPAQRLDRLAVLLQPVRPDIRAENSLRRPVLSLDPWQGHRER